MNGGDIVGKVLQAHGVRFLFTLCGGHISPILKGGAHFFFMPSHSMHSFPLLGILEATRTRIIEAERGG